ncbi:MFS transporter [Halobacteriales archaeon Cl-PHB]
MLRRRWSDPRFRRWFGWAALATVFLLVSFHRVTSAVLAETLATVFDTTGAELGLLHAAFFYVYAPMQIFAGVFADRLGTRWVSTIGTAVMGVGVVWFALSQSYLSGFGGRLLLGLGGSVVYIATLRYCANWFRADEFATVTGLTISAAGVGGLLAATPLAVFAAAVGWRAALLTVGAVGLGMAVVVYVLVRNTPADAGLPAVEGAPTADEQTLSEVVSGVRTVIASGDTWLLGLMLFFGLGINFTVMGLWGVPYVVRAYDVSVQTASLYTLVGNAGFVVGPPVLGWLSDRLENRTGLILVSAVLYALCYAAIAAIGRPPLWFVGVAFFLVMFFLGGLLISFTVVKERHATEHSGIATGTVNGIGYFGAAVLPGVMGWVLDVFWTGETVAGNRVYSLFGYRVAFTIAAAGGVVALGCAAWLHWRT